MTSINPNLIIYKTKAQAIKGFNKENKPCHLLFNTNYKVYLLDLSKDKLGNYSCYTLISNK